MTEAKIVPKAEQWMEKAAREIYEAHNGTISEDAEIIARACPDAPSDPTGRTPTDYAVEHGGYLANAAQHYLDTKNRYDIAVAGYADEGSEVPNADELADCHQALRVAIFEFRKRVEKLGACAEGKKEHDLG